MRPIKIGILEFSKEHSSVEDNIKTLNKYNKAIPWIISNHLETIVAKESGGLAHYLIWKFKLTNESGSHFPVLTPIPQIRVEY